MKKIESIHIADVYNIEEVKGLLPFYAESLCSVCVSKYGYLHDVGVQVDVFPAEGKPEGWDTFEYDFRRVVREVKDCWEINDLYGYH